MKKFSASAAISFGWNTFKENAVFLILVVLVQWAVSFGFSLVTGPLAEKSPVLAFLVTIVSWILGIIVSLGVIKITLNLIDNGVKNFEPFTKEYKNVINYIIATVIAGLGIFVGLILLIIPGLYLALRWSFYPYFIADKGLSPMDALKASWEATKGETWDLVVLGFIAIVINILGLIPFGLGLLVTLPITSVAYAYVYRRLSSSAAPAASAPAAPPTPATQPVAVPAAPSAPVS